MPLDGRKVRRARQILLSIGVAFVVFVIIDRISYQCWDRQITGIETSIRTSGSAWDGKIRAHSADPFAYDLLIPAFTSVRVGYRSARSRIGTFVILEPPISAWSYYLERSLRRELPFAQVGFAPPHSYVVSFATEAPATIQKGSVYFR